MPVAFPVHEVRGKLVAAPALAALQDHRSLLLAEPERFDQRLAHPSHVAAGRQDRFLGFRRDRKGAGMDRLGQLIEVVGQPRLPQFSQELAEPQTILLPFVPGGTISSYSSARSDASRALTRDDLCQSS